MHKKYLINLSLIGFLFAGLLLASGILQAATVDELKSTISERQELIEKLDGEIKQYEEKIDATRQQGSSLKKEIQQIDLTREKLQTSLVSTQNKIVVTDSNINNLQKNIQTTGEKINESKEIIAESLRQMQSADTDNLPELIVSLNHLTDLWDNLAQFQSLNEKLTDHIASLRGNKKVLEVDKGQKEQEKNKLANLKEDISDQKQAVDITKQNKDELLATTKSKESNYQKLIANRKAKRQEVEAEMAQAEAQLKYALDPSQLPGTGTGVIGWPTLKHVITQGFGNTAFSQSSKGQAVYNGKGHNGIDLAASVGTKIYSAEDGQVTGTGNTDLTCVGASYGKWVLIKHNNGLSTLYAHLSLIKVKAGQAVKRGEVIALSGNTGYSTGPHLHFSLYASGGVEISSLKSKVTGCGTYTMPIASYSAYLNPLNYL